MNMRRSFALLLGSLATALPALGSDVEIIAHRGASHDAPENTLPAVELAWKRGADAVEIDVFLSADGEVVAIHDSNTRRTTGHDRAVVEQNLAELKELDAGRWKAATYAGTRIPTLGEVLSTVPAGKRLVIEIKCGPEAAAPIETALDASGRRTQVLFISFDFDAAVAVKKAMADVPSYWLYGFSRAENKANALDDPLEAIEKVTGAGLDGIDVNHRGLTAGFMRAANAAGIPVVVYTVNKPSDARKARELGVAGITTDRPAFLREALGTE